MMQMMPRRHRIHKRGFSLIEVLIAVTVLALGLLGLAAVFPVVVAQQRDASNAAAGEMFVSSIKSYLESNEVLDSPSRGWAAINPYLMSITSKREWVMLHDGDPSVVEWNSISGPSITIPLSERLWPASSSVRPAGPRFVWDIAALAPDTTLSPPDDAGLVRVAVFVRPVDTNIRDRANPSASVWSLLQGAARVPVAEDRDGIPTRNGNGGSGGGYAELFGFDVTQVFNYSSEDRWTSNLGAPADGIVVSGVTDVRGRTVGEVASLLTRAGQRIVDRHGNVYRITASKALGDGAVMLRLDPPISDLVARSDDKPLTISEDDISPFVASSVPPVVDPIILEKRP